MKLHQMRGSSLDRPWNFSSRLQLISDCTWMLLWQLCAQRLIAHIRISQLLQSTLCHVFKF